MKKVLLFLIDSMMPDVLEQCIAAEKAPGLKFFMERGQYIPDCVTVFPTMTASIDCSLITGVYPDQHKIPGLVWYDPDSKKMINYINGTVPVIKIGLEQCATNVLYDLNDRHLSRKVKTIHEELEEAGLVSGSINVIAHRGHKRHKLYLPPALDAATGFSLREKVSGPTIMSLGTLVRPSLFRPIMWNWSQSAARGYGINDTHAIDVLIEVVLSGKQPDFTLVYLPENDHKLHRAPHEAVQHLSEVDAELVRFLDSYPSWEQVLEENVCIFISDHGQTLIGESTDHNVDLMSLLSTFSIHRLGANVSANDEIVLCNNERMTYLYPLRENDLMKIVEAVSSDVRIDLISWKEGDRVKVRRGGTDKSLSFWKGGMYQDIYGQSWSFEGDLQVLDVKLDGDRLLFDEYPDAFSRLYGSLFSQSIPVIVLTAAQGYEFVSEAAPTHLGGGSHGSLHKRDSLVPLLIAGASRHFLSPARLVDVKDFILQELGVAIPKQ
ncbi:alkaline phosphatase family protein [Brevibacillus borstelensis]|uniref:alkaline phosphatase family protein n=1 Tax=Brevibacillus borstelensis TaxID=45462 RepID=UPI00046AA89C|nr:alkaline phosphatase family protein [Brevibacillus borstelensis]MCC0564531.1 alkaline phosphatase family protein [Brevibacillus borstelensis]MCM3471115.1 alkaline phosphatase family protein [Brevibacillus borstelensis]MCM3559589.1 alkaline phosphatase family protein [Brevibacillus borstelensis]MCM3591301.1 alkaline phosphatase family protein [Brevibacillus borstelensis]MCM3624993.1 alkaline phosphatase family protein [Brevibacillus borstelensis]